ncbi:MAG: peptidase M28 [Thermoproteota archaeon]|nr:MAG: peptidase M28 [Candidatus Korarchaeota archaeon]
MPESIWDLEKEILSEISHEVPWKLVEEFSRLERVSGTEDERKAADYIRKELERFGVPYQYFEPLLYLSWPIKAEIKVEFPESREISCRLPAFSASGSVTGELFYVKSEGYGIEASPTIIPEEVRGKIAITEGLSSPTVALRFERAGTIGQIYVNPGERIHESTVMPVWGTPTPEDAKLKPKNPVVDVNRATGEYLLKLMEDSKVVVTLRTELKEGWFKCPLIVAEIRGKDEPEKFVLLHGHLDSWYYGVGDNATGDAALLEIAMVFHKFRDRLKRSLRIAWWPGHSTGRYAGSTWYADHFALDLLENCIAHSNCDSPGCKWDYNFDEVMWTPEAEDLCKGVIREVAGKEAKGLRPERAGDYSFNNLGITGFYMLSSNIPEEIRREKGFYPVGGCGGNVAWHTPEDTLEVADPEILERDIKVYAATIVRVLNSMIYPFNFLRTVDELIRWTEKYSQEVGEELDLSQVLEELHLLRRDMETFYRMCKEIEERRDFEKAKKVNEVMLGLSRILVPLYLCERGTFEQDLAIGRPPIPLIADCVLLPRMERSDEYMFLKTKLIRGRNKVISSIRRARNLLRRIIGS